MLLRPIVALSSLVLSRSIVSATTADKMPKNILGTELQPCCTDPMTGFFRDGFCNTNSMDQQ